MRGIMYLVFHGTVPQIKAEMTESESGKIYSISLDRHIPKEEFFEFRIEKSEVTNQTILIIKDFAEKVRG